MQREIQKGADTQRLGRPPRDRALRVEAFKIPEQQQPEIPARRQTRPADRGGIERRALPLDEGIKTRLVEHASQSRIERVPRTHRQIRGGDPHRRLPRVPESFAHRHAPQYKNRDRFWLMI